MAADVLSAVRQAVPRLSATEARIAQVVLEHWGVRATSDIGDIVFVLVDLGYLISQPTDNRADFIGVYNFDRAFEHEYPWNGAALV